jgi:hypothetical protein
VSPDLGDTCLVRDTSLYESSPDQLQLLQKLLEAQQEIVGLMNKLLCVQEASYAKQKFSQEKSS